MLRTYIPSNISAPRSAFREVEHTRYSTGAAQCEAYYKWYDALEPCDEQRSLQMYRLATQQTLVYKHCSYWYNPEKTTMKTLYYSVGYSPELPRKGYNDLMNDNLSYLLLENNRIKQCNPINQLTIKI